MSGRVATFAAAGLSALALAIYAFVIGALFAIRAGVTMELPWWLAVAAPVALYAILAAVGLPRASARLRVAAFGALCVAHGVVAGFTAILVASVADITMLQALGEASLSFLPAPLLQLLAVPLIMLPLRSLLPRARVAPRRADAEFEWARPRGETVPGWQVGRPLTGLSPAAAAEPSGRETGAAGLGGTRSSAFSTPPRPIAPAAPAPPAPVAPPASTIPAAPLAASRGTFVVATPPDAVPSPAAPMAPPRFGAATPSSSSPVAATPSIAAPADEPAPEPRPATVAVAHDDAVTGSAALSRGGDAVATPPGVPTLPPAIGSTSASTDEPAAPAVEASTSDAAAGSGAAPRIPEGETIAIPFDRVAAVLPSECLAWDATRIAEELAVPGSVLVPVALVLPQLAAGFVAVEWLEVAAQFPTAAFRGGAAAVAARLPEARLPLPIDEIVRRLPPEIFAPEGSATDLNALESFPMPFQPVEAAPPLPEPLPSGAGSPSPRSPSAVAARSVRAEAAIPEAATPAAATREAAPAVEPTAAPADAPALEPAAGADTAGSTAAGAHEPSDAAIASVGGDGGRSAGDATVREAASDATAAPDMDRAPAAAGEGEPIESKAPDNDASGTSPLERLARVLASVGSLSGSEAEVDGRSVYVFRPPSLAPEAVLAAAGPALAVLRSQGRRLAQLSVHTERGALVLTPLAEPGAAVLVLAAAPLDGSLALLEILSLRVAAPPSALADAEPADGLEPVAAGPAADLVAGALTAFGALAPSVVRDPDGRAEVCVLHAPGEPIRDVASVAHATCAAMSATDAAALGAVRGATLRLPAGAKGGRRVALRPVANRPCHWIAVAPPAGEARPGLVELEIARAAARAAR